MNLFVLSEKNEVTEVKFSPAFKNAPIINNIIGKMYGLKMLSKKFFM